VQLQGIAIQSDYAGQGYGSQLLNRFEEQVRQRGGRMVSLGSAAGYVEHFYLKNGYVPVEYLVRIPRDDLRADYQTQGYEILRERWAGDEKFLKIRAAGYDPGFKAELKQAFNAHEVVYIFEKRVS
jgi:GNAT superfamily N-acetyltransferase